MAKLVTLIVTKSHIGNGTEENPCRILTEYWDLNENLIFADDPFELPAKQQSSPILDKIQAVLDQYRFQNISATTVAAEINDLLKGYTLREQEKEL